MISRFECVNEFVTIEPKALPETISKFEKSLLPIIMCSAAAEDDMEGLAKLLALGAQSDVCDFVRPPQPRI